jgi:SAM-dependent methyltransferase
MHAMTEANLQTPSSAVKPNPPRIEEWTEKYRRLATTGRGLMAPTETLVRMFKGPYIADMPKSFAGLRALDVGFGNGNNSLWLCALGLDVYGVEIGQGIVDDFRKRLDSAGYKATLAVGSNLKLPFESDFFDFLISWNVLHYENTEATILAGIAEYARVLKPGGRLFLSTTGPEHKILTGAKTVGAHLYEIGRDDDFRKGERFFYFDAPNYIHFYFGPLFADVMVGRTHDYLFTETLDWWLVTGRKRADGEARIVT